MKQSYFLERKLKKTVVNGNGVTYTMMTNTRPGRDLLYTLLQGSDFVDKRNEQGKLPRLLSLSF